MIKLSINNKINHPTKLPILGKSVGNSSPSGRSGGAL